MRTSAIILIALMLTACADTDPYKRLEPAPTPEIQSADAGTAYATRWPIWFKCVQTVTIDFGPVSRTLVGYLLVNTHGQQFRLQGMTEQGLKLFEVAKDKDQIHVYFAAEEFDDTLIQNVVRDIGRVFLENGELTGGEYRVYTIDDGTYVDAVLPFPEANVRIEPDGAFAHFETKNHDLHVHCVGNPARVDWYDCRQSDRSLYRVDHYEWQTFGGQLLPTTVVLREPGIQSDGPSYKLTIKITELTVRGRSWADRVFQPEGE